MAKATEWTKCPQCLLSLWPDRRCHNCIPASFRAETARMFAVSMFQERAARPEVYRGSDIVKIAVEDADALIAELVKIKTERK